MLGSSLVRNHCITLFSSSEWTPSVIHPWVLVVFLSLPVCPHPLHWRSSRAVYFNLSRRPSLVLFCSPLALEDICSLQNQCLFLLPCSDDLLRCSLITSHGDPVTSVSTARQDMPSDTGPLLLTAQLAKLDFFSPHFALQTKSSSSNYLLKRAVIRSFI